jgi:hypothetical protein
MTALATEWLNQVQYELYPVGILLAGSDDVASLPWQPISRAALAPATVIKPGRAIAWVALDEHTGTLKLAEKSQALAGFRHQNRKFGSSLVMLGQTDGILVNGVPALPMAALALKDCVVLAAGFHVFVTERVKPYDGPTPAALFGKPCPFCRLPHADGSRVAMCRCGVGYHLEPKREGASDDDPSAPLRCFERAAKCISCSRNLTTKEYLEWEPTQL